MAKINDTTTFPNTTPALGDHVPGTDVSNTTNDANGETVTFLWSAVQSMFQSNMGVPTSVSSAYRTSTILSSTSNAEGAALIGVEDAGTYFAGATVEAVLAEIGALLPAEANADVTDETNVLAALSGATLTEVDPAATDKILILDADDTFNIKNITWSDVTATAGGASAIGDLTDVTITSAAQGDILYHNGTAWVDLSPGTNGHFLQTQGAGANPQWASAAGSGDAWGDVVDADILPTGAGSTYDVGSATATFAEGHFDALYVGAVPIDGTTLADPNADRILFWDDSEGTVAYLTAGSGVTITGATMTTDASVVAELVTLAATTNGNGASLIGIEDAGTLITATTVEGALAEIAADVAALGAPEGTAILSTGEIGGTKFLREDGDGTCSWQAVAGGGDVSKVGAPVDGQIGVWTGDGTIEGDDSLTFDTTDDTLVIAASGKLGFGAVDILSDSAGTTTLQNIDALDATTEATIEAAIDTLANLTSVQGHTVTLTGDLIRSGAHSLTLTTGATTSVTVPASGTLLSDSVSDNLTVGFTSSVNDDGSKSGATTYAPDPATGNYKQIENAGAFTFNPPSPANDIAVSVSVLIINHATTAGTITTSGFTQVTGDSFDTTGGNKFLCRIDVYDDGGTEYSLLQVVALQ